MPSRSHRFVTATAPHLPASIIMYGSHIAVTKAWWSIKEVSQMCFPIESTKGELGVYLVSDGSEYPWRAKLRGPSFVNLQMLPEMVRGYKMSDVIAILGSLDFVVGEVNR